MRIAVVASPFLPVPPEQYGGTEQVIYYLIKGLLRAGHEPILLGTANSSVPCEVIPISDQPILIPKKKSELKTHVAQVRQVQHTTRRKLKELLPRIDIIHSHGFDLLPFKNFPNLTTLHNIIEFKDIDYYKKRKDLYYAPISQNQQAAYPSLQYTSVIYNGEDPDDFPVVTTPEKYVCFLGRFDRDKNPHMAIQLAISLGMKIKLAGKIDHKGEGYFEEEIVQHLNHPLVEYLGELGFAEKVTLLSNAQCNFHPTNFREPFGLTVLEAAYCGTPTLAINRGAMPEIIESGRTGYLVEDFIEGYQHVAECIAMDRAYIASRARQLFNYQTMTGMYVQAYETIIGAMPRPTPSSGSIIQRLINAFRNARNT